MRVLGIDCGSERTGYGIIDSDGSRHSIVAAGTIRSSTKDGLGSRLAGIARELRAVVDAHQPEQAAVEEVFHAVNTRSAIRLSHVRGVALLVLAEAGLPTGEYSALEIKKSVVGYGRAEKEQVQYMIRSLLGDSAPVKEPDACDALAAAICHATHAVRAAV